MPATTEVGRQTEKDGLEQWADEIGIGMDQLADRILQMAELAVERRSAARLAADKEVVRIRAAARSVLEANTRNVISIFPVR